MLFYSHFMYNLYIPTDGLHLFSLTSLSANFSIISFWFLAFLRAWIVLYLKLDVTVSKKCTKLMLGSLFESW